MKAPEWLSALAAFTPAERRMLAMLLALALLGLATLAWHRHHAADLKKGQFQSSKTQLPDEPHIQSAKNPGSNAESGAHPKP